MGVWELTEHGAAAAAANAAIELLTYDRDPDISSMAASLLGVIGPPAAGHGPRLLDMLGSRQPANRERAAWAIGQIRPQEPLTVRELTRLLDDEHADVCLAAADALGNFGEAAHSAARPLLTRFRQALIKGDASPERLAAAVAQIFPDAAQRIREHFAEDAELCRYAEDCLEEARAGPVA
jgi:HEAT repeat protein